MKGNRRSMGRFSGRDFRNSGLSRRQFIKSTGLAAAGLGAAAVGLGGTASATVGHDPGTISSCEQDCIAAEGTWQADQYGVYRCHYPNPLDPQGPDVPGYPLWDGQVCKCGTTVVDLIGGLLGGDLSNMTLHHPGQIYTIGSRDICIPDLLELPTGIINPYFDPTQPPIPPNLPFINIENYQAESVRTIWLSFFVRYQADLICMLNPSPPPPCIPNTPLPFALMFLFDYMMHAPWWMPEVNPWDHDFDSIISEMLKPSDFESYTVPGYVYPNTEIPIPVEETKFASLEDQAYFVEIEVPGYFFILNEGSPYLYPGSPFNPGDTLEFDSVSVPSVTGMPKHPLSGGDRKVRGYYFEGVGVPGEGDEQGWKKGLVIYHMGGQTPVAKDGVFDLTALGGTPGLGVFVDYPKGGRELVASFVQEGYDVLLLDRPGYGYSTGYSLSPTEHIHNILDVFLKGEEKMKYIKVTDVPGGTPTQRRLPAYQNMDEFEASNFPVIVSGQSLGASMASNAMYENYQDGGPRTGDYNLVGAMLFDGGSTIGHFVSDGAVINDPENPEDDRFACAFWLWQGFYLWAYGGTEPWKLSNFATDEPLTTISAWPGYFSAKPVQDIGSVHGSVIDYNTNRGTKSVILCEGHHGESLSGENTSRSIWKALGWAHKVLHGPPVTNNTRQADIVTLAKHAPQVSNVIEFPSVDLLAQSGFTTEEIIKLRLMMMI